MEGRCALFVSSGLISGFRGCRNFTSHVKRASFLPLAHGVRHGPVLRSVWKVTVVASFYQKEKHAFSGGGGLTHLSYITYLFWAEKKTAPKMHIPSCCPHWELRCVVTCQRNPFVLRTGYGKEKKGVFSSEQLLWWVPRETSICLRWEELSSSNHRFPWLFKTFISSHLISPSLWWMSGRALPLSLVEGELS